jgi:predicted tellurium resistance membrane protein TerC
MEYAIELITSPVAWVALATLIVMEVVLGIDNLIFIAILTNKLPEKQRPIARYIGIGAALILRLALLGVIVHIARLTEPVYAALGYEFSWRDIILIAGGLFLVWKATKEIHHRVDPEPAPDMFGGKGAAAAASAGMLVVIVQILLLDIVFSVDSILTAIGMTKDIPIMFVAVIVAVIVMMLAATPLSNFINANPTVVMLALGFLLMIGMVLIAEGFGVHVPKGYVYAAMAFSALVEGLNLWARRNRRMRS